MNSVRQYMKDHNLDDEGMAKVMSEKLGRSIGETQVRSIKSRKEAPAIWLNALGVSPQEPSGLKVGKKVSGAPGVKSTEKSTEASPGGTIEAISLPFEVVSAKATIELIYTMAGKGAAMASRTPQVSELWETSAPMLAEGWIEWAKENRTVANGIALLTVGGPGGQVILTNASLLISTLMLVQQQRGLSIIPPQFVPPHERPDAEAYIAQNETERAVDDALRNSQG